MPQFEYRAKEGPNKIISGVIEAPSRDQAVMKIIQLGFAPLDVFAATVKEHSVKHRAVKIPVNLFNQIKLSDTVLFTRQMSDLVNAHVPILRALQIVSNQTHNVHFKEMLANVFTTVKDGGSLSQGLAKYPHVFAPFYINLAKTGEVSGQLDTVLKRLADYLEKEQEARSKIFTSLLYPTAILIIGIIVIIVLLTFVIPRLSAIFEEFDQQLPLPTMMLMAVSQVFANFWWLILGVAAIAFLGVRSWIHTPAGRKQLDSFKLRIPILGEFIRLVEVGRFSRTLGTLIESGIVITTSLQSVALTMENVVLREQVEKIAEEVSNGVSMKLSLQKSPLFPEMAVNMISVGEETGRLEQSLMKVADSYERQTAQMSETILKLFGMGMLLIIVMFVGFVVICMLLPLLSLNLTM